MSLTHKGSNYLFRSEAAGGGGKLLKLMKKAKVRFILSSWRISVPGVAFLLCKWIVAL